MTLSAPFPYFGGKSRAAELIWARLGDVPNYVEPFAGSLAVLLGRPHAPGIETVNDIDGFVANAWRAIQADPLGVSREVDWPVNENDLHARHAWLVGQRVDLTRRLEGDPAYYDVRIAGWWLWGISCWIGGGWCSGEGSWHVTAEGRLERRGDVGKGVHRKLVHLSAGKGVHRQLVHLSAGSGVHRQIGPSGLLAWFEALAARLRMVRVCSGDWARVLGPTPTTMRGLTGVVLDPPYSAEAGRTAGVYAEESGDVAHAVRAWALAHGDDPQFRIALCGYEGEHDMPASWCCVSWKASGGYGSQGEGRGRENANRERVWFSPHCLQPSAWLPFDVEHVEEEELY